MSNQVKGITINWPPLVVWTLACIILAVALTLVVIKGYVNKNAEQVETVISYSRSEHTQSYHTRTLLTREATRWWSDRYHLTEPTPLATRILAIPGVLVCYITAYRVEVTKAEMFEWAEIWPAVVAAVEECRSDSIVVDIWHDEQTKPLQDYSGTIVR